MNVILVQYINQLREGRCDPYTLLVLDALHSLQQNLLDDSGQIISCLPLRHLLQIHEHGHKRSLSVTGHQRNQLVLNGLNTGTDLLTQTILYNLADDGIIQRLPRQLSLLAHLPCQLPAGYIHKGCQM